MSENKIDTIYTDGIGKIHFFGNMIRIDLMSFVPAESDDPNEKPTPRIETRLVMNPNAFLASYESFVNMIDKLTKAGILTTNSEAEEAEKKEENKAAEVEVSEVK